MQQPFILVVTATLGTRESISRTIESVEKIGGNSVFHLIIAPEANVSSLKSKFPNVSIIAEPHGLNGIYGALNFAFQTYASEFEFVTFINDDDFWMQDYSFLIDSAKSLPHVDAFYGRVVYFDENSNFITNQSCSPRYLDFKKLFFSDVILFTQQSVLFRSKLFFDLLGFDEVYRLAADTDFWIRAIDRGSTFKYVNKSCAGYTIQSGQLSSDGELQEMEHSRLRGSLIKPTYLAQFIAKMNFRMRNLGVYFSRLLSGRMSMKRTFHKK